MARYKPQISAELNQIAITKKTIVSPSTKLRGNYAHFFNTEGFSNDPSQAIRQLEYMLKDLETTTRRAGEKLRGQLQALLAEIEESECTLSQSTR